MVRSGLRSPPSLSTQIQSGGSVADGRVGGRLGGGGIILVPISQIWAPLWSHQSSCFISRDDRRRIQFAQRWLYLRTRRSSAAAYLHDAVPVVARGDLEQGEEGHAEVLKGGVTTHTLAWVVCIANCSPE